MSQVDRNQNQHNNHSNSFVKSRHHLILYTIAFVFAFLDVVAIIIKISFLHYLKHIMMVCFIIIAFRSASKLIVFGEIFGMLGDILLMVSSEMQGTQDIKKLFFVLGASAFLVGHIFYIINNIKKKNLQAIANSETKTKITILLVGFLALSFYLFQVIYYFLTGIQTLNILIVVVYGMFLVTMVMSTVLTYQSKQDLSKNQYYMRVIGSFVFLLSDSTIMYTIVYKGGDHILHECLIVITYDIAQVLILKGNQIKSGLFGVQKQQNSHSLITQTRFEQ